MPLPFISVPPYPDVPPFLGVPPIPRNPITTLLTPLIALLTTDAPTVARLLGIQATPSWGIWDASGQQPVLIGDSVIATDFTSEYQTTDAPVEAGSFTSYNRVQRPVEMVVTMTKGGSVADRHGFLLTAQAAAASTTLYTVVMPEATQANMNVVRMSFERTRDQGTQLIKVELHLREILTSAAALFTSTKDPSSAGQDNSGAVQAVVPVQAQAASLDTSIPSFSFGP